MTTSPGRGTETHCTSSSASQCSQPRELSSNFPARPWAECLKGMRKPYPLLFCFGGCHLLLWVVSTIPAATRRRRGRASEDLPLPPLGLAEGPSMSPREPRRSNLCAKSGAVFHSCLLRVRYCCRQKIHVCT